jgi:hypothetical protein
VDRVEDIFTAHKMPHSVARALGSTLLPLFAGSVVGFTGRGFWTMALGSIQWAVGRVCVVRVLMVKDICWKGICGC